MLRKLRLNTIVYMYVIADLKMAERNVWGQPQANGKFVIHR